VNQEYQGRSRYLIDEDLQGWGPLHVAVVCLVGDLSNPINALFDTGSQSCIMPAWLAGMVAYEELYPTNLFARGMWYAGSLIRASVTFPPDTGKPVRVDATWFLSSDWDGPVVIGWKGCLDRLNWGFASDDWFYFAGREEATWH
jgi:hypothetical protein